MVELQIGQIQAVLRATGYVTNGQAYDLAELVILLQKEGYAKALERACTDRELRNSVDD